MTFREVSLRRRISDCLCCLFCYSSFVIPSTAGREAPEAGDRERGPSGGALAALIHRSAGANALRQRLGGPVDEQVAGQQRVQPADGRPVRLRHVSDVDAEPPAALSAAAVSFSLRNSVFVVAEWIVGL